MKAAMSQAAPAITRSPAEVVRLTPVSQAPNGVCYAVAGEVAVNSFDLERMVATVPRPVAAAAGQAVPAPALPPPPVMPTSFSTSTQVTVTFAIQGS